MKIVYLDKRELIRSKLTSGRLAVAAAVILIAAALPIWPDRIEARCSVMPAERATVRAEVPGLVREMRVHEGDHVAAGDVLAVLHNRDLESAAALAKVENLIAQAGYSQAQLSYASLGPAIALKNETLERERLAREERERLTLKAPIAGVVTTRNVQDEVGSYKDKGDTVVDLAGTNETLVEAYVPEFDLRDVKLGQRATVLLDQLGERRKGSVVKISQEATAIAPGLMHLQEYKGLEPPKYYVAQIALDGGDALRDQSTATAKIQVGRASAAHFIQRAFRDFVGRKIW